MYGAGKDTDPHRYDSIIAALRTEPHPLPLLHAAKFFVILVEQVLLIGDSPNNSIAARAAGCPIICVSYGYNHGEPVDRLNLDAVNDTLPDVIKLIRKA
ncbi:hypothetical protein [Candidatus Nitrotoga sp. 1052]|uniref:hypothetical protein n=1 Tax=Candidatus Nitrotoga sp. 1052 TaxID=2886964 RepID=UPI001F8A414A|nr:hypothetical protein NTG1052_540036 [Candidatus Nitrotoga sp. 1052]